MGPGSHRAIRASAAGSHVDPRPWSAPTRVGVQAAAAALHVANAEIEVARRLRSGLPVPNFRRGASRWRSSRTCANYAVGQANSGLTRGPGLPDEASRAKNSPGRFAKVTVTMQTLPVPTGSTRMLSSVV